jgi:hypothetical protein
MSDLRALKVRLGPRDHRAIVETSERREIREPTERRE